MNEKEKWKKQKMKNFSAECQPTTMSAVACEIRDTKDESNMTTTTTMTMMMPVVVEAAGAGVCTTTWRFSLFEFFAHRLNN